MAPCSLFSGSQWRELVCVVFYVAPFEHEKGDSIIVPKVILVLKFVTRCLYW
jgi:hypothetical protein